MKKVHTNRSLTIIKTKSGNIQIYSPGKSRLYNLNESASFIFRQLLRNTKEKDILKYLNQKFDLPIKQVKKDYIEFVKFLKKRGLVFQD